MKSLIHGFGSGFGRAIGRFMAFLVLGLIVIKILDVFNVDIRKFTKFLYLDVKAASSDTWTDVVDLKDTHLFENDMYSYIQFCNNTNLDSCAVVGRNAQSDYGWSPITVNFNTNYLRLYNNQTILKNYKKYRVVITQTGNTWTPVNSRYFITLNSIGGTNLYSSNTVYSSPDNTIYIEFTPLNNNDILDLYIRTVQAPNYFWVASGSKNFTVVKLQELASQNTDNSQQIIDNATQNTQDIINNQNNNSQQIIDSINDNLKDCHLSYNLFNGNLQLGIINGNTGLNLSNNSNVRSTDYIPVDSLTTYSIGSNDINSSFYIYEYKSDYSYNLTNNKVVSNKGNFTTNSDTKYVRFRVGSTNLSLKVMFNKGNTFIPYEEYNVNICTNKIDDVNSSINDVNSSINDDNVSSNTGTSFFNDFEDEDFGLSEIITLPIATIQQLTSKTCVPLVVPLPYTNNKTVSLPCMTEIYQSKFSSIYNIWKTVSFGIIAYFIATDIFYMVKGFKDPESDKVEVLDL